MEISFYLEKLPARRTKAGKKPRIVWSGNRGMYIFLEPVEDFISPRHALEACKRAIRESYTGKFMPKPYGMQVVTLPNQFYA